MQCRAVRTLDPERLCQCGQGDVGQQQRGERAAQYAELDIRPPSWRQPRSWSGAPGRLRAQPNDPGEWPMSRTSIARCFHSGKRDEKLGMGQHPTDAVGQSIKDNTVFDTLNRPAAMARMERSCSRCRRHRPFPPRVFGAGCLRPGFVPGMPRPGAPKELPFGVGPGVRELGVASGKPRPFDRLGGRAAVDAVDPATFDQQFQSALPVIGSG
jgi:hypothetical protein